VQIDALSFFGFLNSPKLVLVAAVDGRVKCNGPRSQITVNRLALELFF